MTEDYESSNPSDWLFRLTKGKVFDRKVTIIEVTPKKYWYDHGLFYDGDCDVPFGSLETDCVMESTFSSKEPIKVVRQKLLDIGFSEDSDFNQFLEDTGVV